MSRQTRKANAFVIGIGRTHRIVIGDTLIAAFPENETEFVVAHELGHYVNKDTWRIIAVGELLATTLFFIANAAASEAQRAELKRSRAARCSHLRDHAGRNAGAPADALRILTFARMGGRPVRHCRDEGSRRRRFCVSPSARSESRRRGSAGVGTSSSSRPILRYARGSPR